MTRAPLVITFVGLLATVVWLRTQPAPKPEFGLPTIDSKQDSRAKPAYPSLRVRALGAGLPDKGEWRGKPLVADLNGDGRRDIAASIRRYDKMRIADGPHVFLGDGGKEWKPSDAGLAKDMGYGGLDAADVTGDGRLDLVYSGHDLAPRVFANFLEQEKANEWIAMDPVRGVEGVSCSDVAFGDFDRDGHVDLAVMGFFPKTGGLYVMRNEGTGEFDEPTLLMPKSDYGAIVRFVDLDGDGGVELVAATSNGAKTWSFRDGKWAEQSDGLPVTEGVGQISGIIRGIDARDIDGDGKAEIAVSCLPTEGHPPIRIFRREGEKWVNWGTGLPTGESFFDVVFARLATGATGLFLAGKHGAVVVQCQRDGTCQTLGAVEGTAGILNVGAGDVDGDGADDLLVVGQYGLKILAIENTAVTAKEGTAR